MSDENTQSVQTSLNEITINADLTTDLKPAKYRFKKDKLGNQRPTVEINIPVPSYTGLVKILQDGGKGLELLMDAMYDVVRGVVSEVVADENFKAENFDPAQYTWEKIANMPKEDRRSVSISDEQWEAFAKDYVDVMPGITGKSPDAIGNAVLVYQKKFAMVKTNKNVLKKLKDQLALYAEHSPNAENFTDILELLFRRVDNYLAADDVTALVENL